MSLMVLENLKRQIWSRRPILGEIIKKHGQKTLYDYSRDFMDVNPSPLLDKRKPELIKAVEDLLAKRLGADIARRAAVQLRTLPLVSTTDHHGPIDHPFFVNANIISGLPYYENLNPDIAYLIVFSFASISVNNASAYPRGIAFHGGVNGSGNFIKLPILPDKLKMGCVYRTRGYTREDLDKAERELIKRERAGEIVNGRSGAVMELIEESFGKPEVLASPDLASQITEINFKLWPKLFHPVRKPMPDLIYLEIETLVTELLLRHHLSDKNSLIYRLLFNSSMRSRAKGIFNNLAGAFSSENEWGTHFFWGMDEKNHRLRMHFDTTRIFSQKHTYEYEFSPSGIAAALKEKKIFPGMLLCYLVVSLYYGMKCLGGFCQVHDLTMIKEAWHKLLIEEGESAEADALAPVQTKELGGDGLMLAYEKTLKGGTVPATGIDMAIGDADTSFEHFVSLSKRVTLEEMMNPMIPEIYRVLYSSFQRDPALLKLTPEQILADTGLQNKLAL